MGDPGRSGESIGKEKLKKLSFVEVKGDEENQDDFYEGESVKEEESSMNLNRFEHTDEEVKSTESADQNKWGKEKEKADEDLSDWEFTEQMEGKRGPNKKVEEKLEDVDRSTTTENHQVTEEKEDQVDSGVKQVEEEKEEQKKEETDDTVMENDLVKEEEEEQKEEADDRIEENYPAKAEEEAREEVDDRLMENYQVKEEEEEVQKEEEADKDQNAMSTSDPVKLDKLTTQHPAPMISIEKIATMEKRCDFGLFIHKTDVMVVGGQAENGNFLDDMLKIHVPTGQVCKADGKLAIPLSGMQVESTAIHQSYLVQFFDTTSCFYGE